MNIDSILKSVTAEPGSAFFYTPAIYKNSKSYFFNFPVDVVSASDPESVGQTLLQVDKNIRKGLWGFGAIAYECGYLFEKKLNKYSPGNNFPYLKFFFFNEKDVRVIDSEKLIMPEWRNDFEITNFRINTEKEKFTNDVNSIRKFIAEGDTYQVNYTVKGKFNFSGSYVSLFKQLVFNQSARYTAFINTGDEIIISLSPELFFKI